MKKNIVANLKDIDLVNIKYNGIESEMTVGDFKSYLAIPSEFSLGYSSYVAKIRSNGTSAPLITVVKNELSDAIVWTRSDVGDYVGTLSGAFPTANKTVLLSGDSGATFVETYRIGANSIGLLAYDISGVAADNLSNAFTLEVRVYD